MHGKLDLREAITADQFALTGERDNGVIQRVRDPRVVVNQDSARQVEFIFELCPIHLTPAITSAASKGIYSRDENPIIASVGKRNPAQGGVHACRVQKSSSKGGFQGLTFCDTTVLDSGQDKTIV